VKEKKQIALVAHDKRKQDLLKWVQSHQLIG
jgi:methylglyoxal synthase